jgi:histidine triad (HIT) family protein
MPTIFTKIIQGEIPSTKLHEDSLCIAILDIAPANKGHALVIAKEEFATMGDCPDDVLAHLMVIAKQLDQAMRSRLGAEATNIVINNGPAAGQEVPHLHIHVIPRFSNDGKRFSLSKSTYGTGEIERYGSLLQV